MAIEVEMQVYNDKKQRICTLKGYEERKIVETLDSGDKELTFKYPVNGTYVNALKTEYYMRTKTDEYVIRAIKTGEKYNEYTAQLNVEELEGTAFPYGFESQEQTIGACLEFAFSGTGWTVKDYSAKKKRSINKEEATTAWDVLQDCLSTYRVECKIDSINKCVSIYDTIGEDRGCYFIEKLNLKKLTAATDTYDFYTQLMPVGKDGITIDNNGKNYLENYTYSIKKKLYVWKDERYTKQDSLLEDGTAKLAEMAKPYTAYTADVVDLAKTTKDQYSILDYAIGDTVTIVSKRTNTREKQRIVKITSYPESPQKNTVELSSTTKTFAEVQKAAEKEAKKETQQTINSVKNELKSGYYTKIEITKKIEETEDGLNKTFEKKIETTKAYAEEQAQTAQENAEASAAEKLKQYTTTIVMRTEIQENAEQIKRLVAKTSGYWSADEYEKDINYYNYGTPQEAGYTDSVYYGKTYLDLNTGYVYYCDNGNWTKEYECPKTTEELQSRITEMADKITSEVSRKLEGYATVQDTSRIDQKADEINSEVSKKVGANEIISRINQSAEQATIEAEKINFNGVVTANRNFTIGLNGKATMPAGKIGPFEINSDGLYYATAENTQAYINYNTFVLSNSGAAIRLYPSVIRIAGKNKDGEEIRVFEINAGTGEIVQAGDWTASPW